MVMDRIEQLRSRREQLLGELAGLEQIRRGSVVEQFVDAVHKDGSRVRRGPYPLYSFKHRGRTVSRRLRGEREAQAYRRQIAAFRRFQDVVKELVAIGEELSDRGVREEQGVKKTPRSRSSRTGR
jgi:hypothetical protein